MPAWDEELFMRCWQSLYEQAVIDGFSEALAERFAEGNAEELYQQKIQDRIDDAVTMRRAG